MIIEIEEYFVNGCGRCKRFATPDCSTRQWESGLRDLRAICLAAGLKEELKWAHPCYTYAGRNIAIMGAFRADYRLTFFNASLMTDPEGVLERQGANTAHPDCIRFTDNSTPTSIQDLLTAYLQEAIGYAEKGVLPRKRKEELEWPEELTDALEADPELSEAFHRLTPGRRKSYILHVSAAKKSSTRISRIAKSRPKILEGKGANER